MLCHALCMDVTAVQERMTENIRVLLAMTGMRSQAELARRLEWEPAKVTRLLKGSQDWTLSDIVVVADAFGLEDPFLLARPLAEVVGAVPPHGTTGSVSRTVNDHYRVANHGSVIPFPLDRRARHHTLTGTAQAITLGHADWLNHSTGLTGLSSTTASSVTPVVGL